MTHVERLAVLTAVDRALSDVPRLVATLSAAEDDADALRRLREVYDLSAVAAEAVLSGQFLLLTRARRAALATEVAALRDAVAGRWDPPLDMRAVVHSPTDVRIGIDGTDHRVRGRDLQDALERLADLVREQVAGPRRRRVVIATGLTDGPVRVEVEPRGGTRFVHADEVR